MANRQLPTVEELHKLFDYDKETGRFHWRTRTPDMFSSVGQSADWKCKKFNATFAGREAFTAVSNGYFLTSLYGSTVKAHRVAFAMITGAWPEGHIDHANGNRGDNRAVNLRAATRQQNNANVTSARGSTSRFLGVYRSKTPGKWVAQINVNGRSTYLGAFKTEEGAAESYNNAAKEIYGDFARINQT